MIEITPEELLKTYWGNPGCSTLVADRIRDANEYINVIGPHLDVNMVILREWMWRVLTTKGVGTIFVTSPAEDEMDVSQRCLLDAAEHDGCTVYLLPTAHMIAKAKQETVNQNTGRVIDAPATRLRVEVKK